MAGHIKIVSNKPLHTARLLWLLVLITIVLSGCRYESVGHVVIQPANEPQPQAQSRIRNLSNHNFTVDPDQRYGGYVLTATLMPHGSGPAYRWAKNIGTLVAYEAYLRRYPNSGHATEFREAIRERFVPDDPRWKEAWTLYSQMEIIDGAVVDGNQEFILIGRKGNGRLSPFFYDDLVTALKCTIAGDKVGVTMNRVFSAEFREFDETAGKAARGASRATYDTSVDFYSDILWNTHLSYILFEADRMLKSLSAGYDIFLREDIRSSIPGFKTTVEMESARIEKGTNSADSLLDPTYGRIWIELTNVLINTTKDKNVAVFSDFEMEVRAESKYEPPMQFARHLRTNYRAYSEEFPIFGEVERAARIVAIARWLVQVYPELAQRLVDEAYEQVDVYVPQIISARKTVVRETPVIKSYLVGGVIFPKINQYEQKRQAKVADTQIDQVTRKVLASRPDDGSQAWYVELGAPDEPMHIAWEVGARDDRSGIVSLNGLTAY